MTSECPDIGSGSDLTAGRSCRQFCLPGPHFRPGKLELAGRLGPALPVNVCRETLAEIVHRESDGWGADVVFEASGDAKAASEVFDYLCPGGTVVLIGMPGSPIAYDVLAAQVKEARVEHVFRYAHVYPQAVAMLASGKINCRSADNRSVRFPGQRAGVRLCA